MRSMTGYGAAEAKVGRGKLFVEIRTVNHRYCDLQLKIPPKMGVLDPRLRKLVQTNIERGKVDFFLKEKVGVDPAVRLVINEALVHEYQSVLRRLAKMLGQKTSTNLLDVVELSDLVQAQEATVSYDNLWPQVKRVAMQALSRLNKMRDVEGRFLQQDQLKRVAKLNQLVKLIHSLAHLDEKRLQDDVSPLADRADVAEEITRLQSHLQQYRGLLNTKGAIGRQLDFLLQEMNREINTIGSKAMNTKISRLVVEVKSELEKLREQVQNIE